mmetsp:Transcript_27924/g.86568  ORF Transcript_27924/g.86568 Transcript_27924/m.86568 type:complete len:276 (+) Transcript_27924:38-865(+)
MLRSDEHARRSTVATFGHRANTPPPTSSRCGGQATLSSASQAEKARSPMRRSARHALSSTATRFWQPASTRSPICSTLAGKTTDSSDMQSESAPSPTMRSDGHDSRSTATSHAQFASPFAPRTSSTLGKATCLRRTKAQKCWSMRRSESHARRSTVNSELRQAERSQVRSRFVPTTWLASCGSKSSENKTVSQYPRCLLGGALSASVRTAGSGADKAGTANTLAPLSYHEAISCRRACVGASTDLHASSSFAATPPWLPAGTATGTASLRTATTP